MNSTTLVWLTKLSFVSVAQKLLFDNDFFQAAIERLAAKTPTDQIIHEVVANFISIDSVIFSKPEVFDALHCHVLKCSKESATLKCLALITSCSKGMNLADEADFLSTLISILLGDYISDAFTTHAIMALKNCMLTSKSFENISVPWPLLTELLVYNAYTKENDPLQQYSIQALRIMSDKPAVKEELCKVYKSKIRQIPCLSEESSKLKDDLVQWLSYRNYKSNDLPKYKNLFI